MISKLARCLVAAASLLGTGCAYSLVDGGAVREKPFEAVVARTVAARGIEPRHPIDARVISTDEIGSVVRRAIEREWSDDEIERHQRAYTALGVWPADRNFLAVYVDVLSEEVGGLYDPVDRVLYLVDTGHVESGTRILSALLRRDLGMEMVLTHELVHALQHEAYPFLLENDPFFGAQDDAATAVQAAIEGDATLYGLLALDLGVPPPDPENLRESIDADIAASGDGALADAPAMIRLTLSFPYTYGYRLAFAERGALLESPPISTEQVLHTAQRRASLVAVDLRPLYGELPEGCSLVHEDTLGELGISVAFRNLAPDVAEDAWIGWDGDRYLVAECNGELQLLWLTFWDSQSDALEFADAYAGLGAALSISAGLAGPPRVVRSGRSVLVYSGGLAAVAGRVEEAARQRRVRTLGELRDHFAAGAGVGQSSCPPSSTSVCPVTKDEAGLAK